MAAYSKRCKEPAKLLPPPQISDSLSHLAQDCGAYYITEMNCVGFDFDYLGSLFDRSTALIPVAVARKEYFLITEDLAGMQSFKNGCGQRFYRFADVLQAGMLRCGRKGLLEKMLKVMDRDDRREIKRSERRMVVDDLVQMLSVPAQLLTARFILKYSSDFVRTGHGVKKIEKRIYDHNRFSYLVSLGATAGILHQPPPLYLSQAEQYRVAHLQIAYVMTGEIECLEESRRIVQDMRRNVVLV